MNGDKFLMELIKSEWKQQHKKEFVSFLENQRREEKIDWTKKIINTNMPVLAIKTPVLKQIAKEIQKGNYIDFLDLDINNYYENTIGEGIIINLGDLYLEEVVLTHRMYYENLSYNLLNLSAAPFTSFSFNVFRYFVTCPSTIYILLLSL